ncbi:uncharacterized protein TrAtP1_004999 [Trichoderma atroviride]|uniref:uncharacterized protein n=1 Tax=Hypocrea atroviridis TaxID=63577 RepID=UPI00331BE98C|nr:hypothetical protein TrAtP1_004999 [Trichoderma atroviride]
MASTEPKFVGWVAHDKESANGSMVWEEFDVKPWEETDIDIKISHCGICGTDLHKLRSGWGPTAYPIVVGHEIVGTAVRVGKEAAAQTGIKVGDRVGVGAQGDSCQCRKPPSDQGGSLRLRGLRNRQRGLLPQLGQHVWRPVPDACWRQEHGRLCAVPPRAGQVYVQDSRRPCQRACRADDVRRRDDLLAIGALWQPERAPGEAAQGHVRRCSWSWWPRSLWHSLRKGHGRRPSRGHLSPRRQTPGRPGPRRRRIHCHGRRRRLGKEECPNAQPHHLLRLELQHAPDRVHQPAQARQRLLPARPARRWPVQAWRGNHLRGTTITDRKLHGLAARD